MPDTTVFGTRLKQLRAKLKLSQRDFAEKIGVTASALSSYEKGQKNPSVGVAMNIATQFHVSLDWLCGIARESDFFIPDEYICFDLPGALLGLFRLIEEGFLKIRDDEEAAEDRAISDSEWVRTLDLCNGDLSEFLTAITRISELHANGALGDTSYEVCINELISNYANIIQKKERKFYEKIKTEGQNSDLPF